MNEPNEKSSSEKENKKVRTDQQSNDNPVREGEDYSINQQNSDKSVFPYEQTQDKQFDNQPEFIDRNSDSKNKS
ncbi:MAG: hypothetical protein JO072_10195 [Parafilimonas sp.]|nr:hypothetical protein [Parafilimonas sp.]